MSRSTESYAHKAAKAALVSWLQDEAQAVGIHGFGHMAGVHWQVGRGAPDWGVWTEYPIVDAGDGGPVVWQDQPTGKFAGAIPTFDDLCRAGVTAPAIVDVLLFHRSHLPAVAFEIVHKNDPDWTKCYFLEQMGLLVRVVPAYWILAQVGPSRLMPGEFSKTFRQIPA